MKTELFFYLISQLEKIAKKQECEIKKYDVCDEDKYVELEIYRAGGKQLFSVEISDEFFRCVYDYSEELGMLGEMYGNLAKDDGILARSKVKKIVKLLSK